MPLTSTPKRIEKEYEFSEIFISYEQWGPKKCKSYCKQVRNRVKSGADFGKLLKNFLQQNQS